MYVDGFTSLQLNTYLLRGLLQNVTDFHGGGAFNMTLVFILNIVPTVQPKLYFVGVTVLY
jgi:hypothetical protein